MDTEGRKRERKRDILNPFNWIGRSRSSSSRAPKERLTAKSSHTSASSSHHRPSTSLVDPQSAAFHSTSPLPTTESQLRPRSLGPLSSASLPSKSAEALESSEAFEPQPPPSDLWNRAFREANTETQKWIQKHGLDSTGLAQSKDQIKELIGLVKSNKLFEQRDEPLKVEIGNQTIIVREYIADAVAFITMVGDATIAFAPPQASAPWAVAKAVLKIPVKQIEQKAALLGTVQWFARIVRRGQIYEELYKAETTDDRAIEILHGALFDVYKAALELLASSDTLFDSRIARQTLAAILRPDGATGKVKDLYKKEQQLVIEVQVCEGSRSAMSSKQANDSLNELKKQLDQLSSPLPRIDKQVANLLAKVEKKELDELMHFISSEMFGKSHAAVTEARVEKTGDWLLASKDFRAWQDIPSSSSLLCLKGTVGTGKSYLTSKVVDYVKQTLSTSQHDEGFAFFYCNRSGPSMQDPIVVLRSFVRQLAGKAFDKPDLIQSSLVQKCETAKREGRELGYKDCKDLILESLNLYSKTTIILDALDESDITIYNLGIILIEMMEKSRKPIKIFLSTRSDREYLKAFEDKCIMTLDASNQQEDIERFLTKNLYSTLFFTEQSRGIQDEIKHVFTERSCGMFRWVYLQVKSLRDCTSDDAIHDWARELPQDLMAAYDQLWENIRRRNVHDAALAERAIMWVLCYFGALKSVVLLEAIQYAVQGSTVVRKEEQTQQRILSLCQDLLTIDEERDVWMLPHASVAEYFETKGWMNGKCDALASKVCIGFLENYGEEHTFFELYVQNNWYEHVGRYDKWLGSIEGQEADPGLVAALKRFLGPPGGECTASYRKWCESNLLENLDPTTMALNAMCQFGIYHTLRDWWLEGKITKEMAFQEVEGGDELLTWAVYGGSMPIFRHLISLVDTMHPDAGRYVIMALIAATLEKNMDFLKVLVLEANADVNHPEGKYGKTAAQFAAMEGRPEALQWMMDQGIVDLERENDSGYWNGNILIAATGEGNVESVQILLKAGANVNAAVHNGKYGSALTAAARNNILGNHMETLRLLIDGGADPNLPLKAGDYGSALEASVALEWDYRSDREETRGKIQQMLLEAGADPTAVFERGKHGSALAAAAFYGRKEILKVMVDRVGAERAIEVLRQSRHPDERPFEDEEDVQRWKDTATYLAKEVRVGKEILHSIGFWDVEPERSKSESPFAAKFILRYR